MARPNPFPRLIRDQGPVVFFVLVTLGGMAFIWTAKLWQFDGWFVTVVPIILMLAYFVMSLIASGLRLQNEQAGDNLYYMGFLFTLCSLGVSLYQFTGEASIDHIVRNFGIAISSTIAGIALRIFFNQMRRDPIDIERSVRHELAEMTRRVRTELDNSAREFASYRRISNQMLSEGFEEIARQAEKNGGIVQKAIEALSKDAVKPIQEAAEKMATVLKSHHDEVENRAASSNASVESATKRLEETTIKVNSTVEGLEMAIDNLRKRLEDLKSPEQSIQMKLQPTLQTIQKSVDIQIESMNAHLELSKVHVEKIDRALAPISEMAASIKGSAELMDKASAVRIETKASIDRLIERIDKQLDMRSRPDAPSIQRYPGAIEPTWPTTQPEGPQSPDTSGVNSEDAADRRQTPTVNESWLSRLTGR